MEADPNFARLDEQGSPNGKRRYMPNTEKEYQVNLTSFDGDEDEIHVFARNEWQAAERATAIARFDIYAMFVYLL